MGDYGMTNIIILNLGRNRPDRGLNQGSLGICTEWIQPNCSETITQIVVCFGGSVIVELRCER